MARLSSKLRSVPGGFVHYCPGCEEVHKVITSRDDAGPKWSWNDDAERPTCNPSILIKTGKFVAGYEDKYDEGTICHYFILGGKLQFLNDCTHKLAGLHGEIPDFPFEPYGGETP